MTIRPNHRFNQADLSVSYKCTFCFKVHTVPQNDFSIDGFIDTVHTLCPRWKAKHAFSNQAMRARQKQNSAAALFFQSCTQFIIGDAYDNPAK